MDLIKSPSDMMFFAPSLTPTKQVQVPAGRVNSRVKLKTEPIKMGMMQKIIEQIRVKASERQLHKHRAMCSAVMVIQDTARSTLRYQPLRVRKLTITCNI